MARAPYWYALTPSPVAATPCICNVPIPEFVSEIGGRKGYTAAGPPSANRRWIWGVDGTAIGCVVTLIVTGMVRMALDSFTITLPE